MKKSRIVIASVLKPADDVRAFEKMASTLVAAGYEVYLIGMPASTPITPPGVRFLELVPFSRLNWKRALAPLKVLQKVRKVKPEYLIVNTHELLIVSLLNRILFGVKILYDVQENYYQNIIWTHAFPSWLRRPLATWVRLKERLLTPFFHRVIFAEKCYRQEMKFMTKKSVVLENKSVLPPTFSRRPEPGKIVIAFTGTLAVSTGVFEAIELAEKLYEKRADIELHIVGSCPLPDVLAAIKNRCFGKSYIRLTAGKMQVGHDRILDLISRAHFGIISYPRSPHTANRIPTKLFEYASAKLPILLTDNPAWTALTDPISASIRVDFKSPDADRILDEMSNRKFYTGPVNEFLWRSEETRLTDLIGGL